ncbi:helix-turn-helix transcriptional regulator [Jatrophihabitans telluris]|uniref:Helix-turn-helix transcriptional regulator n=1 Tax=Jatrophihabitans telluris TaxID=2038343 RepID=A0ABY4R0M1_9ACTN|nr:helix-turn-helix transcriptional regulator [Jatrophihabitans telluris]UQX89441.1 helix-turn-helix transcriptional regulator [Jatrophihabitans telluris]
MTSAQVVGPDDGERALNGPDAGTIGHRLRDARNRLGWSLAAASHVSGISAAALGSYERGSRTLTVATLAEVARTYETNVLEVIDPVAAGLDAAPQNNCVLNLLALGGQLRWGSLYSFAVRVTKMRDQEGVSQVVLRANELDVIAASYALTTPALIEQLINLGCAERLPDDRVNADR